MNCLTRWFLFTRVTKETDTRFTETTMFILVKYGANETLLCNPSCHVVNLLTSIKRRAGYGNSNLVVDIADETGLVKELDTHKQDHANKHLASHGTYVLVSKEILRDHSHLDLNASSASLTPQYQYIPLLEKYEEIFPNFNIRSEEAQKAAKTRARGGKSPSPAGRYSTKTSGKKTPSGRTSVKRK